MESRFEEIELGTENNFGIIEETLDGDRITGMGLLVRDGITYLRVKVLTRRGGDKKIKLEVLMCETDELIINTPNLQYVSSEVSENHERHIFMRDSSTDTIKDAQDGGVITVSKYALEVDKAIEVEVIDNLTDLYAEVIGEKAYVWVIHGVTNIKQNHIKIMYSKLYDKVGFHRALCVKNAAGEYYNFFTRKVTKKGK